MIGTYHYFGLCTAFSFIDCFSLSKIKSYVIWSTWLPTFLKSTTFVIILKRITTIKYHITMPKNFLSLINLVNKCQRNARLLHLSKNLVCHVAEVFKVLQCVMNSEKDLLLIVCTNTNVCECRRQFIKLGTSWNDTIS